MKAFRAPLANLRLGRRAESSNLFNPNNLRDESMHELGAIPRTSREPDVLQLSGSLAGDVKESRNDSSTCDLQMAADRTRSHTLCGPVVSSLFFVAARC